MTSLSYHGCSITPRTFQVRGTGVWTLELVIACRSRLRGFSGPQTFPTEDAAIRGCFEFGRRIIDGEIPNMSVEDL